jgi:hypothetical protein
MENVFDPDLYQKYCSIRPRVFPSNRGEKYCYKIEASDNSIHLKADYYIGVDWLVEGQYFVQVQPKLNTVVLRSFENEISKNEEELNLVNDVDVEPCRLTENSDFKELDYLKLLLKAFDHEVVAKHTDKLIIIDWDKKQIPINQKDDTLTPFLVVQFLNLLKGIVRRGLKRSYYTVQKNLHNKVKGKILVGNHIKQNLLKHRFTKTYCEYQQFGIDHQENRFLKKALNFCRNYVHENSKFLESNVINLEQLIYYCSPAFELVGEEAETENFKKGKFNPFFKEYKEAIKIGQYILKRFAYNISNTTVGKIIDTPPFWIDMPKLFELYVYSHLMTVFNDDDVKFQFPTYGNVLDFLIIKKDQAMVVDAKYKMHYLTSHIHQDIRQVSGYARLSKVYKELKKETIELIDCLIIYPSDVQLEEDYQFSLSSKTEIAAYKNVCKIGIQMPYIR